MQRYFAQIKDNNVYLTKEDEHHILNVIRSKVGDKIEVVDNGNLFLCEIISLKPLSIKVVKNIDEDSELKNDITLYYCLSKGDKNDLVIQKSTELGVKRIVLVSSKRCVVKYDNKNIENKIFRFYKIAKEAAEQSHRLIIPKIEGPFDLRKLKDVIKENNLFVAYEENKLDKAFEVDKNMDSIGILIGPEGGLELEEINCLNSIGFKCVSLGKRILRTETAAIYALSVISNNLER